MAGTLAPSARWDQEGKGTMTTTSLSLELPRHLFVDLAEDLPTGRFARPAAGRLEQVALRQRAHLRRDMAFALAIAIFALLIAVALA